MQWLSTKCVYVMGCGILPQEGGKTPPPQGAEVTLPDR